MAADPDSDPHAETLGPTADGLAPPPRPALDPTEASTPAPPPGREELGAVDPACYERAREIARGGMGRVVAARDRRLDRPVALKELLPGREALRGRFAREVRITARLQHPAIVPVHEGGRWPGGEPFYAMKLVDGESLDKAIAARRALAERLALLPSVIAVADAIAYAHSRRVVHRDLKPSNVVLGAFGEAVVIDWGLAKELGAGDGEAGAAGGPPSADGLATEAGSVLGTPAYMAPEQARGEEVDERADVYALGALLHQLLSGAPPEMAAGRVWRRPLRERQPDVAPDLAAIVNKALADEPGARYGDAGQMVADLKRFQTGQLVGAHRYSTRQLLGRWLRRHRGAVGVAAVALALLAAGSVISVRRILAESEAAERARRVAERDRADAEGLMDFMLFDLHDKLEPLGRLPLLGAVADRARDYFGQRGEPKDGGERRKRSVALLHVGDVLRGRGDHAGALAQYHAALAIREQLGEVAEVHRRIGDALLEHGDQEGALAAYRRQLATARQPREQALAQRGIGRALRAMGDHAGAVAALLAGLALSEEVADARQVAGSRLDIGSVQLLEGEVDGALASFRQALELAEREGARDPSDVGWRRTAATAHDQIGSVLYAKQDFGAAVAPLRTSLAITDQLAAQDPTNTLWQRDQWLKRLKLGDVLLARREPAAAAEPYRAALAIAARLSARDPDNAEWRRDLEIAHNKVGDLALAGGDATAALAAYREALVDAEALAGRAPENREWQRDLGISHDLIGNALLAGRDGAGALAAYGRALVIRERLAAEAPGHLQRQRDASSMHMKIGQLLEQRHDAAGARRSYEAALTYVEAMLARNSGDPEIALRAQMLREKLRRR